MACPSVLPSAALTASAPPRKSLTRLNGWPALPGRRFADTLAGDCARLGADADRYSFIAADSHRLLLAGLPAHKWLIFTEVPLGPGAVCCTAQTENR